MGNSGTLVYNKILFILFRLLTPSENEVNTIVSRVRLSTDATLCLLLLVDIGKTSYASIIEFGRARRNNGTLVDIPSTLIKLVRILLGGKRCWSIISPRYDPLSLSLSLSLSLFFQTDTIRDKLLINLLCKVCTKSLTIYHNATAKHAERKRERIILLRQSLMVLKYLALAVRTSTHQSM